MADPLSIASGVAGLLTVAFHVSVTLKDLITKANDAPHACRRVRTEIEDVRNVLGQLQLFLTGGGRATRSRQSLIMIDQVTATLASCITTFDGLKLLVEGIHTDFGMGILDRARWVFKTTELEDFQQRLETHKSSLTLMLVILTCQKQDDAENKVDALRDMVEKIYAMNTMIAQRMAAWDMSQVNQFPFTAPAAQEDLANVAGNTTFSNGPNFPSSHANLTDGLPGNVKRDSRGFAFEELLMNSRAYKNAAHNNSDAFSVISAAGRTATWSMLSGLSLGELSNIAILAIPIYANDLNDKDAYDFDVPITDTNGGPDAHEVNSPSPKPSKAKRSFRDLFKRPHDSNKPTLSEEVLPRVFAVPLSTSMLHANVAISLTDENGESFIYGYLPIVVAKCGVFLKEKGVDVAEIFATGGHAARIAQLSKAFDTPPRFGKGLDWTGYSIYDAASLLLRYLKSLPEPIVPYDHYDAFSAPLREYQDSISDLTENQSFVAARHSECIASYQRQIVALPSLNRQLLLYILDLLAVFASKCDENRMTPARLVAVFQPALLSKRPHEMSSVDHQSAADVSIYLLDNQDSWLIGMAVTDTTSAEAEQTPQQ